MPSPFPFNPDMIPTVPTRKALLILDLQNDFVSPEGPLYVTEPEDFVNRTLNLAKTFRDSGAGYVIWVRSEFESHCSLLEGGDQIMTADSMLRPQKMAPSRGRQPTSTVHDSAAMEADQEAFLSVGADGEKEPCVRKGTRGAEFAPPVKAAIDTGRDIVFTKTRYSAFASGQQQLVQLLRRGFVTKMYLCGALTNISIYATALGAGQHGYEATLLEDCCGFRSTMRHLNAVRQLVDLTGCEVISSETLLEQLSPGQAAQSQSTGLSPSISKITLDLGGGSPESFPAPASRPTTPKDGSPQPQPEQGERESTTPPVAGSSDRGSPRAGATRPSKDSASRNADSDPSSPDSESTRGPGRKSEGAGEAQRSEEPAKAESSKSESSQGPIPAPEAGSTEAEKPRAVNRVARRVKRPSPEKKKSGAKETTNPPRESDQKALPRDMADQAAPTCSEPLCEGDTTIITNVLPPALAAGAFERLLEEVSWAGMSHMGGEVPRRIAVQGAVADDGSMPVYRHPADESPPLLPFSPTVLQIKNEVEKHLGHPLNHVLIQHYRTGNDYISEHSDKTLDIVRGSFIANVSLGAERTMVFRTKRPPKDTDKDGKPSPTKDEKPAATAPADPKRQTVRAALPHNSLCRMGLQTNARWLHAIRQDKRLDREKTPAELAYSGARISLTFRQIGTFIDASQTHIWGQGATSKTQEDARSVVNGQTEEAVRLLQAFGAENNRCFEASDWDAVYGKGFDVLHMGTPKRFFAATRDRVGNLAVALALAELGVGAAKGSVENGAGRFEDNDPGRTVVHGCGSVLRYLDAVYGPGRRCDHMLPGEVARRVVRLQRGLDMVPRWKLALEEAGITLPSGGDVDDAKATAGQTKTVAELMSKELAEWEGFAKEAATAASPAASTSPQDSGSTEQTKGDGGFYIAGRNQPSPADFVLWPVLHDIVRVCGDELLGEHLGRYYAGFKKRSAAAKALGVAQSE
jgi:nicotinamidase-related amidase